MDISYWESLISQLKAHTARGRLRDRHQQLLISKLEQLKAEQFGKKEEGGSRDSPIPGPSNPKVIMNNYILF